MNKGEKAALYDAYLDCLVAAQRWRISTLPELWEASMVLQAKHQALRRLLKETCPPEAVTEIVEQLLEAVRNAISCNPPIDLFFAPAVQLLSTHSFLLKDLADAKPLDALNTALEAA